MKRYVHGKSFNTEWMEKLEAQERTKRPCINYLNSNIFYLYIMFYLVLFIFYNILYYNVTILFYIIIYSILLLCLTSVKHMVLNKGCNVDADR